MKKIISILILNFTISLIGNAQISSCHLAGASVYIDYNSSPFMMNVNVNGSSTYNYSWIDTNGIVSSSNQTAFYSQWCVTITDINTGCDTIICQDCVANTSSSCACPLIYLPVCGCDGIMYSNSCIADCADIPWIPAVSNGLLGGFLPCSSWTPTTNQSPCDVEILADSIVCSFLNPQILTASVIAGTPPYSFLWGTGQSNSNILTINSPGNYCVTVTDGNNCSVNACINISLSDIPIFTNPSSSQICLGDSIMLEFANTPLTDILWYPTGDTTDIIFVHPTTTTNYIVEGTDINGCDRIGEVLVTVDTCNLMFYWDCINNQCMSNNFGTGSFITYSDCLDSCQLTSINNIYSDDIFLHPNPTKETLTINLNYISLNIYDIFGNKVLTNYSQKSVNVSKLNNGIYYAVVNYKNGRHVQKIIIKK